MEGVYINNVARFLPNEAVSNDRMEEVLGMIHGKPSRAKSVVLRSNGIRERYYALGENGKATHTNADLTYGAIRQLIVQAGIDPSTINLLSCGTSTPDQLLPSHTSMVHGLWQNNPMELNAASGICTAGMNALKYGFMAVASGNARQAVCTGSERVSSLLKADKFFSEPEENLSELKKNPVIAFEQDFLRWMLSDGAGAILLGNQPNKDKISLKIHWIDGISYAHELAPCMYAGAIKEADGHMRFWSDVAPERWYRDSLFTIKQDIRLLDAHIIEKGVESIRRIMEKHQFSFEAVDHFLPHISSFYFKERLLEAFRDAGILLPPEKWFINLDKVGNVGAASIYLQLHDLFHSGKLNAGERLLLSVPESGRFSYVYGLLEVV